MRTKVKPEWLKTKIGSRFAFYITLLGAIMALVLSILISYQQYQNRVSFIQKELDNIVTANKSFIEQSLWIVDTRALDLVVKGFLLNAHIVFVQITDENGNTIVSKGKPDPDKNIKKTVSLYHHDRGRDIFLGKLTVAASKQAAFREAKSSIFITLFQSMLLMFILSVSIIFIFWHLVSRHLLRIQEYTRGITLEEQRDPLTLDRPMNRHTKDDELTSTVDAINFMCRNAVKAYRKLEDETSKKLKLEQQLKQAQRMETVGRLAGGVAHDFNNMLYVILGTVQLLMTREGEKSPILDDLRQIQQAARRSADITRQLLAFSRKQVIDPKVININPLIKDVTKMLKRLLGEDIDILFFPEPNLYNTKVDPGQLDQIITNLAINARDAMPEGGTLTLETANITFDLEYCRVHAGFKPGSFVMLAISDNGTGIDPEILPHIFEPFFTTKDRDKGTGLGLASVYGAVKHSSGFINVYSEPGKGSCFKLYFPACIEQENVQPERELAGNGMQPLTVLLVEDDDLVRQLTENMLGALGHRVLVAATPNEALKICRAQGKEIDLLLSDVILPGMTGKQLFTRIREIVLDMRVLYMSGYTANVITHQGIIDQEIVFLQKPFTLHDLEKKIREAIATPS